MLYLPPRPPPACRSALNIQIQQGVVQGPTSFVEGDEADVAEQVLPLPLLWLLPPAAVHRTMATTMHLLPCP